MGPQNEPKGRSPRAGPAAGGSIVAGPLFENSRRETGVRVACWIVGAIGFVLLSLGTMDAGEPGSSHPGSARCCSGWC